MFGPSSSSSVSTKLRRVVDWKIFELSASLIEEAVEDDLRESVKWFQPRHAEEIIEERQCQGCCGYPLCRRPLSKYAGKARFRIDYGHKQIFEIDRSGFYCSADCLERSELWMSQLESTLPHGRPIAKTLLTQGEEPPAGIDQVLDILNGTPAPAPVPAGPSSGQIPPPHPLIGEDGAVQVRFEHGLPVPVATQRPFVQPPPHPQPQAQAGAENMAEILQTMKELQVKYNLSAPKKPSAPAPPASADAEVKEVKEVASSSGEGKKTKKKAVEWDLADGSVGSNPSASTSTSKQPVARPVSMEVKERANPQPMSVRAMATKKEPSALAYVHRMNDVFHKGGQHSSGIAIDPSESYGHGEIEGYAPKL